MQDARSDAENIRWAANLTTLYREVPLLERPDAAAASGFLEAEYWWPFGATGRPSSSQVDAFVTAINDSGISLVHMNVFAGDMDAGERGVLSYPDRSEEFRDSIHIAMDIARRTGVRLFNAPFGHRVEGLDAALQDETAFESLDYATRAAAEIGGTIMLEPVSGMPPYPLKTARDTMTMIERARAATGAENLGFLFDQFHLAVNGDDVPAAVDRYADQVVHIQLADVPGRHEPGSAGFDLEGMIAGFLTAGYRGALGLEFFAEDSTADAVTRWRDEIASWTIG